MNSIFTEENLLAFTTAARFGSFSKAAEELGLTTSAISYTIKRMETGLDVVLFTRSTRSIELTESGRYFFRKATDLLNDFYAIKRSIDTISQGIEARYRSGELILTHFSGEPLAAHTIDHRLTMVDLFCCTGASAGQVPAAGSEV
ncbi:LysR family transcriptional regulator, partial [Escherichia coli]|uniref:LysR family transcriptional regulator n=1 Tax=Escherichia coli TaxID=562 RepID=UPI0032B425E9